MLPRLKLHRALGYQSARTYKTHLCIGKLTPKVHFRDQDIFVFHDVFAGDGYIGPNLGEDPPRCILDIGAHIGLVTLRFAAYFPKSLVHSYEPDPENFEILRSNTDTLQNVFIHPDAVGPISKKAVLYVNPARHSSSSLKRPCKEKDIYEVECVVKSLDDIICTLGENVDLIKFDMEAFEYETFSYSSLVHRVKHVVGEIKAPLSDIENFLRIFTYHEHHIRCIARNMYLVRLSLRRSGD